MIRSAPFAKTTRWLRTLKAQADFRFPLTAGWIEKQSLVRPDAALCSVEAAHLQTTQRLNYTVGFSDGLTFVPRSTRLIATLLSALFLTACATPQTVSTPPEKPQAAPTPKPAEPTTAAYQAPTVEEEVLSTEPQVETLPTGPSPAVRALVERAQSQHNQGDVGAALATMERAVQIEPESALVWLDLARLRLANDEPQQAEQLALRAVEHAADERTRSLAWQTVARARLAQGDRTGAEDAQRRAGMHAL